MNSIKLKQSVWFEYEFEQQQNPINIFDSKQVNHKAYFGTKHNRNEFCSCDFHSKILTNRSSSMRIGQFLPNYNKITTNANTKCSTFPNPPHYNSINDKKTLFFWYKIECANRINIDIEYTYHILYGFLVKFSCTFSSYKHSAWLFEAHRMDEKRICLLVMCAISSLCGDLQFDTDERLSILLEHVFDSPLNENVFHR